MDKNVYKQMMEQAVPSAALIRKTKQKMIKEESTVHKSMFRTAVLVCAAMLMITVTAFAAWYLLEPGQVAEKMGDHALSAAFNSENAVNINVSQTTGGYTFTLMSIVSGKDISDQQITRNGQIAGDCTYAVIAVQKADGSLFDESDLMEGFQFYVSPYVKGIAPWRLNSYILGGGGSVIVVDGVKYVLTSTDNISMFADRGVYIGINSGFLFGEAFIFNEETGEIAANPAFDGVSVLFELPLDLSLADPVRAQQYLDEIEGNGVSEDELPMGDAPARSGIGDHDVWRAADIGTDEIIE